MNDDNIDYLVAGDDKEVDIGSKRNISALDYINYLVSCMMPQGFTTTQYSGTDIYILTLHDDTTYDNKGFSDLEIAGPYFRVKRHSYKTNKSDAFQIDIGFGNTGTIVTEFSVLDDEGYALLYDYNASLNTEAYVQRIDNKGNLQAV
jgi:hypothetical protein